MLSTIAQCGSPTDCAAGLPVPRGLGARDRRSHRQWAHGVGCGGHEIYMTELDRVVEEIQVLLDEVR